MFSPIHPDPTQPPVPHHIRHHAKVAAKGLLAYGGACLMLIDATLTLASWAIPAAAHAATLVSEWGKVGAAMSGCAVFFDRLMEW